MNSLGVASIKCYTDFMSNSYISEMMLALQANILYLQKEGNDTLNVKNGELISEIAGEVYIYKFTLDFLQEISTDAEVEVRIKNDTASGRVISIEEKNIQIQTDKFLGTSIAEAKLVISSYYLLELLLKKLQGVINGEEKLTDLADKTFGLISPQISYDNSFEDSLLDNSELDAYKQKALSLIMGSEVSFIWGPPGTGKTQLIAKSIEALLKKGLSTLLISHTNVATDGALLRTVKNLEQKGNPDYLEGKILRIGHVQDEALKKFERIFPENALKIKMEPISKLIEELSRKILDTKTSIASSETILHNFKKLEAIKEQMLVLKRLIEEKKAEIILVEDTRSKRESELKDLEDKLLKFQNSNSLSRFFSGTNLQSLTKEKIALVTWIEESKLRLNSQKIDFTTLEEKLKVFVREETGLINMLNGKDIQAVKTSLEEGDLLIKNLQAQKNQLQKELDEIEVTVIKDAKVIATTLTKSYSDKLVLSRPYDCVILDEASMAPLPAVWYATGLALKKVVIVGDFFQLSPIAKHKILRDKSKSDEEYEREEQLVNAWLKEDIFDKVGISQAIHEGTKPEGLEQLKMQYRMHPDIAGVINHLIYGKFNSLFELESADVTMNKGDELLSHEPISGFHVGVYDTGLIGSIATMTDNGSYYNLYQALLCVELAKKAISSGYTNIGIISPFRSQTNLIQKIVMDEGIKEKVDADTVHRFQGGERQVIIFDITTPNPTKLTDDDKDGGDDEKLINVALSRAKEKCVIVADVEKIMVKHSATSTLIKFINYCRDKNYPIISTEQVLNKYETSEKSEEWLLKINNFDKTLNKFDNTELYDETDFYQKFLQDLFNSSQEVILESPFITSSRVGMLLPIFKVLLDRGVKIFIITRPPEEHRDRMQSEAKTEIERFENMGITVLPMRGKIHRKISVIDRNILWEGSLNILSQSVSHEMMHRFLGRETSIQILNFLKLDKNIGKMGENKLIRCEFCNKAGSWYWTDKSRFGGYWTFCLTGKHKIGKEPLSEDELKDKREELKKFRGMTKERMPDGTPICPIHNLAMIKRKGPWGTSLYGCTKFPACRITEKATN